MSLEDKIIFLAEAILRLDSTLKSIDMRCLGTLTQDKSRLIPVGNWNEYHEWPKIGGLRNIIFHEKTNGAHVWIKRIGKRVMIDEKSFFEWARSNPSIK